MIEPTIHVAKPFSPKNGTHRGASHPPPPPKKKPREIQVNARQLSDVIKDAWVAVEEWNTNPDLFNRHGKLVRIERDEFGAILVSVSQAVMHGMVIRSATWVKKMPDKMGDFYTADTKPPTEVATDMLVNIEPCVPLCDTIVSSPVFAADGRLVSKPGYDAGAQLSLESSGPIPEVVDRPSQEALDAARELILEELLGDFPFASEADKAHAVALLLLPLVRRMIDGPTPIHLIEAPAAGSGKTLLGEVVCLLFTGRQAEIISVTEDYGEIKKQITARLSSGAAIILLDNMASSTSDALAAAVTSTAWVDRRFGKNDEEVKKYNKATWIITGNNLTLSLDLVRRSARIRIDTRSEKPWERDGFRHDPLKPWVLEQRPALVQALLVIGQSWVAAGKPKSKIRKGSFESWAAVMGGILDHAGIPGFLGNEEEFMADTVIGNEEWSPFIAAWWKQNGITEVTASSLADLCAAHGLLEFLLKDKKSPKQVLGIQIKKRRGKVVDGKRIDGHQDTHTKLWWFRLDDTKAGPYVPRPWPESPAP